LICRFVIALRSLCVLIVFPTRRSSDLIDERGDIGPGGLVLEIGPAGFGRNPEDALGEVFVAILKQGIKLGAGDLVFLKFDLQLRDRKSTRLNSSHVKISYAVFCLKKKN